MSDPYTDEQIDDMLSGIVSNESNRRPWLPARLRVLAHERFWKMRYVLCGGLASYEIDLHPVLMSADRSFDEVCGMIDEMLKPFFGELDLQFPRPVETEGAT